MQKKFLYLFLIISIIFAAAAIFYKVKYLGFSINPSKQENLWTIEAHVSFKPIKDENIKISLTTPETNKKYKVLEDDIIATGYKIKHTNNKIILSSKPKDVSQDIYYKVMLFDNTEAKGKLWQDAPASPQTPVLESKDYTTAKKIINIAKSFEGNQAEQLIRLLNQSPINPTVLTFLPQKKSDANTLNALITLLHLQKIPARVVRGIKLEENKKTTTPDLMLEAYINNAWRIYDIKTAKPGIPEDFVIFQKGGHGLLDVEGGTDSSIQFSTMQSIGSSFLLAQKRAKLNNFQSFFNYSIYNLPVSSQNTIKWLSIFPLAILIVVLLRNVIGLKTMGTFTPMLVSLSLVQTGLASGVVILSIMIGIGLLIRALLSRLNLLLVPRISAVVVFVILTIQLFSVIGYNLDLKVAQDAVFFPIIILAWIIERASITWEEDGAKNSIEEILYSILVAIITYFVIENQSVRHIMYAFNELNVVILAIIMLLGTYTGYRLTELFRFKSLVEK